MAKALNKMGDYPRFLTPSHVPFDPLELARNTESLVSRGNLRKYSRFGWTGNYGKGIATAYACGCCLRCVFCWAEESRDFPEKHGDFYSPRQVIDKLSDVAKKTNLRMARVSGAEPTLVRLHLLELLALVEESDFETFILETNGILFGADYSYVRELSRFEKVHVRVSLKAGTAQDFAQKTGAKPETFNLPFQAIRNLRKVGIHFSVAAMSADPRLVTPIERICLIKELAEIDPFLVLKLEEEVAYAFPDTLRRIEAVKLDRGMGGVHKWFPRYAYVPIRSLQERRFSRWYTLKNLRELLAEI